MPRTTASVRWWPSCDIAQCPAGMESVAASSASRSLLGLLTAAAPAHAVATIAADTTRAPLRDALAAGRSPTLVAGGLDRTLLRFRVAGPHRQADPRGAAPARHRSDVREPAGPHRAGVRRGRGHAGDPAAEPVRGGAGRRAPPPARGSQWDVTTRGGRQRRREPAGQRAAARSRRASPRARAPTRRSSSSRPTTARRSGSPACSTSPPPTASTPACTTTSAGRSTASRSSTRRPGSGVPGRYVGVYHSLVGGVFVTPGRHVRRPAPLDAPRRPRHARVAAVDRQRCRRRLRRSPSSATRPTRSGSACRTSWCATTRAGLRSPPARSAPRRTSRARSRRPPRARPSCAC